MNHGRLTFAANIALSNYRPAGLNPSAGSTRFPQRSRGIIAIVSSVTSRRGVRDFLRSHPHVAAVSEAPQNEGGQGATLVELRQ